MQGNGESLFRWTAEEASQGVGSGNLMLALLLEEAGHDGLLESEAARAALSTLPLRALRIRRGSQDYANFTSFFGALSAPSVALIGAQGAVRWQSSDLSEQPIVDAAKHEAQQQAMQAFNMLAGQMGQASGGTPSGAPQAAQPLPSSSSAAPPAHSAGVATVSSVEELDDVFRKAGDKVVVVDFYADWCGPCKVIAPHFASLAEGHAGRAVFVKVNVDHAKDVSEKYNVRAMPTFLFFKRGKLVDSMKGADQSQLTQKVNILTAESTTIDWGDDAADTPPQPQPEAEPVPQEKPAVPEASKELLLVQKEQRRKRMQEKVDRERAERDQAEKLEKQKKAARAPKRPLPVEPSASSAAPQAARPVAPAAPVMQKAADQTPPKPAAARAHDTARLSIKLLNGSNHRDSFPASSTLNDVRERLASGSVEEGRYIFTTTYPKKRFTSVEEALSLSECGLVPSGTLILQSLEADLARKNITNAGTSQSGLMSSITGMLNPAAWFGSSEGQHAAEGEEVPQASAAPSRSSNAPARGQQGLVQRRTAKRDEPEKDKDENRDNGNGTAFEY
eukprot:TRINITY_DN36933_c0_g1_i1.p1 TRINITY_DN36933_c0_g1~~TRINITY_DN36933_c0_g1_i1.p1  ORF type:complete len:585 (+),score=205.46 TRINITY_DN36933_c0_g1_i1:70-1755(+)